MTSKNLSINTEKLTPILRCKIALRLRCVICILISFICILSGLNNCFAQNLNIVFLDNSYDSSQSPVDTVLVYDYIPFVAPSSSNIELIDVKTVNFNTLDLTGFSTSYGGYHKEISINGARGYRQVWFADANNIYSFYRGLSNSYYINKFFSSDVLAPFGLSSLAERRSALVFIDRFKISPYDFRSYIQPWIITGIVIAILIPAWYLCRRFLRG